MTTLHEIATTVARREYPDATDIVVTDIEIDGDPNEPGTALVSVVLRLPTTTPEMDMELVVVRLDS
jgi:hypothetical protein